MKIEYKLLDTKFTGEVDVKCGQKECFRMISPDDPIFVDVEDSLMYCDKCGKCLRYERKKKEEREKRGITEEVPIKGLDY